MAKRGWPLFVLAVVLVVGCMPAPRGPAGRGEGPGGRSQHLALSPKQELAVGRQAYAEVMQEYGDRVVPADNPQVVRARRVTRRLLKAAAIEPLQREMNLRIRGYRFEWETSIIRDGQINAFSLPAGKVFLFTGILKVIGDSDDFLATVVSHEIAHALAHHASERIARQRGSGRSIFRNLSHGRMQEAEADHIGVFLMAFADYDPDQAAVFWERMRRVAANKQRLPELLSDHPSSESRIENLRAQARNARAARKAYDEGRILPPKQ
jgi:predicted Zn-dependent protease